MLANCYFGQAIRDYQAVAEWYTKSAGQGVANAQCELAKCYRCGGGVEVNHRKSVELYTQAIERGYYDAVILLADCYYDSHIVNDYAKAVEWYTKAVSYGNATAKADFARLKILLKQKRICSHCGGKLGFLTHKCKKCGKRVR